MAIYHLSANIVSRSSGASSIQSLAYVLKDRVRDEHIERTFDYSRQHDELMESGTLLPDAAREKLAGRDPKELWNDWEKAEKRRDAQLCQRVDCAIPKELPPEAQRQLAREFLQSYVEQGHLVSYGIHLGANGNTHIDFQVSPRRWDFEKGKWGGKKHFVPDLDENGNLQPNPKYHGHGSGTTRWKGERVSNLKNLDEKRELWARLQNKYLEAYGIRERVDHRTLKVQKEEQYDLARKAEKRGDLDAMLRHDLQAADLDREPTKHEFEKNAGPRADIAEHNVIVKQRNAARTKRLRKKVRDSYWSKRAKRDRQRRGRNADRVASLQASQTDSRLSQQMRLDEAHVSRLSDRLQFRPQSGPASNRAIVQASPGRTKPSIDSLFSNSKPARSGEGIEWAIYANKADAADALGISTRELDRRCAKQIVEEREQKRGKRFTYMREKLINRIAGHMSKGDGMICVAKTGGKAATGAIKISCKMLQSTAKMIEAVRGLVGAIPLIGKPLSGALAIAETPLKVTNKIGQAVTDNADKILDDDRRDRQQAQRDGGGQQQSRGQQQQQEQEHDERGGGLPAGRLGKSDDKFDWLDPCMSEMAKAEEEQKQFIRETLG